MGYLVGIMIVIGMLWGGGQGLYVWFTNPEPTTMSCAEYINEQPDDEWLKLTGCRIGGDSLAFAEGKRDSEVYAPVRSAGAPLDTTADLVAYIEDKGTVQNLHMTPDAQEFRDAEVQGMVQFGIEEDDDVVSQLDDVLNVVSDPVIIVVDEEPNPVFAGIMFGLGLLIGGGLLFSVARNDSERSDSEEESRAD